MVSLSLFNGATPKNTPKPTNKKQEKFPEFKTLTSKIEELAVKERMKEDDPLKLMHVEFSKQIDKFGAQINGQGEAVGRQAAEAAATIMRQEARRLSNRIRGMTLAIVGLGLIACTGGGVWIGWSLRGAAPVQVANTDIPRDLAERFPHQNWQAQWEARRAIPGGKDGTQWVLLPFALNVPNPPKP